jgi:hypothetical protein
MRKFIITILFAAVIAVFFGITAASADTSSFQRFLRRSGTNIYFLNSSWTFGDNTNPIADGQFTDLTVSGTLTIGAIAMSGDIDMNDNDLYDADQIGINDSTPDGSLEVAWDNDGNAIVMVSSSDSGDGDYLTIDTTGRLGLNDTTPDYLLDVAGTFGVDGNIVIGDASGDTITYNSDAWTLANDTTIALTGGTDGFNIDSNTFSVDGANNRVGIGTASPSATLEAIFDGSGDIFSISSAVGANGDYLTMDNTGMLGIGPTNPGNYLHINKNTTTDLVKFDNDGSSKSLVVQQANTGVAGLEFNRTATEQIQLLNNIADGDGSNWFYRNLDSGSTAGPVLFIEDDHASDDQEALQIQQDGTGDGAFVDKNESGYGIQVDGDAASASDLYGLYISAVNTGAGSAYSAAFVDGIVDVQDVLYSGAQSFSYEDGGRFMAQDISCSSSLSDGDVCGYSFGLDGLEKLTLYGEGDGSGSIDVWRLGINEVAPETLLEITDITPYITLHNSTEEDTEGGRESKLIFSGEQSGGEETTLALIQASHDGTSDDQNGDLIFSVNDGNDSDSPTEVARFNSGGNLSIAKGLVLTPSGDTAQANDSAVNCTTALARVVGDGGAAVLDTDPAVNDGSYDGQTCVIQGTHDTNTVQIADNVNIQLDGGTAFTMGKGDMLHIVWDSGDSDWYEISRSNN